MSFESFERHQAKELEQQGNKEYGIDKDNAEDKANPEIPDETLEQPEELEKQGNKEYGIDKDNAEDKANPEIADKTLEQQKQDREKNKETQGKMDASKEKIAYLENMDLQNEQKAMNTINEQIDGEMWPPIEFDDTSVEVASQIGHTEGGTSLDRNVES